MERIEAVAGNVTFYPIGFTREAYRYVMEDSQFWTSLRVTLTRVLIGVPANIWLVVMTAYPLSKANSRFHARTFFSWLFVITMLFGGGTIPAYIVISKLGLMNTIWTLTLPGFIWHILLIFIGLLIAFSRMVLPTAKGFWQSTAVFTAGCVIATIINVPSHPYGNADMFYITPYYATTQIVYSQIAAKFGIFAGNAVYVLSIILGAWLLHLVFQVERP